jgi:hypothetical protein
MSRHNPTRTTVKEGFDPLVQIKQAKEKKVEDKKKEEG